MKYRNRKMASNFDRSLILYEREFLYEPAVYNLTC
jgi:hypothetical protein